jgi:hypothetical protein
MSDLDAQRLQAIRDFADRLIPEAFERSYSAYDIRVVDPPGAFDDWINQRIHDALTYEYPSGGRPTGMIIVERHGLRATWHGCTYPGCGLDVESRKAREEVAHFDQPWVFAIDTWGPDELWREVEHPDGTIDEVLTYPRPGWTAPWYAEARGRGLAQIETGVIQMHMWERVGTADLHPGTVFERHARRVLHGHPDRRRHRLRRTD